MKSTIFWLDELRHGPFGGHLMKLATVGRGRGAAIVMGLTDISGLTDLLNEHQAEEVLGSFSTQVLLGQNNPKTAQWVSERLGTYQALVAEGSVARTEPPAEAVKRYKDDLHAYMYPQHTPGSRDRITSVNSGKGFGSAEEIERYERHQSIPGGFNRERPVQASDGLTISIKEVERPLVTKSEVMCGMPRPEVVPGHGLVVTAYVVSPFIGRPTRMTVSGLDHPDVTLIPADPDELPYVERPADQLDFPGWTDDDVARLKLPPLPEKRRANVRPSQTKKRSR
jgi:TraM recognition site of TraD and TraG